MAQHAADITATAAKRKTLILARWPPGSVPACGLGAARLHPGGRCLDRLSDFETWEKSMTDDELDLEAQWLKRELEKTYPRARALMDEVDADDYEAVCLI